MDNLPIPQSRIENLMNAFISRDSGQISTPQSRVEEFWYHLIEGTNSLPIPQSRNELLLKKIIENDTHQIPLAQSRAEEFLVSILTGDTDKLPIPQSRSEYYLDYIARNNLVLDDIEYVKYSDTNITASNTVQKPFRCAILKGSTKYRDIDTGEFLETFEEGRNLELVSVKMPVLTTTGKNLWDKKNSIYDFEQGELEANGNEWDWTNASRSKQKIPCKGNTTYTLSSEFSQWKRVVYYDIDDKVISSSVEGGKFLTFTTPSNATHFRFRYQAPLSELLQYDIQLEYGSIATTYEPYKTNILSSPGEVVLRGFDSVDDTLNLNTGEYVKRIGELTLDGSEHWLSAINDDGTMRFNHSISDFKNYGDGSNGKNLINNKLPKVTFSTSGNRYGVSTWCNRVIFYTEHTNVNDFKQWLSQNPTTVQYELETPIVKTVGLKVVDQDGNPVKQLSAFDETTHIVSSSASDNSLIAIAEVEVPTKLIEALDNIKLLSSDVGMLIDEVDAMQKTQDENSTMTMSAMTELYEIALMMGGNS